MTDAATMAADSRPPAAEFALHRLIAATVAADPERVALRTTAGTVTYGGLDAQAEQVAAALRKDGVGPGDRVAYLAEEPRHFLALMLGAARLRAVSVPLNWRLSTPEVAGILRDCAPAVLVASPGRLAGLAAEPAALGAVRRVVLVAGAPDASAEGDPASETAVTWDDWLGEPTVVDPGHAGHDPDDLALLIYTSGTTGRPKGVMLSTRNLAASIPEVCGLWRLDPTSVMLAVLPMFHVAGVGAALGVLWSGASLVLSADTSAAGLLDTVVRERVTNLVLASVLLQRMLDELSVRESRGEQTDLAALRLVSYGAAPISEKVLSDALRLLPADLLQIYGLTECVGTIAALQPEDHVVGSDRLRSCGRALPTLQLRLVDPETGRTVEAPGEVGEVWVRSPRVTAGYWAAPDATAETVTTDGWLRTGDLAYADDQGYLSLCDRLRDMIVTGGENVYPAEVEDVLAWHPGVSEVAVVGVPDPRWGETPKALVVAVAGVAVTERDLIDVARAHLAHYKCPTSVEFRSELPRNASGKVLRRMLREPYWAGRDRRVS